MPHAAAIVAHSSLTGRTTSTPEGSKVIHHEQRRSLTANREDIEGHTTARTGRVIVVLYDLLNALPRTDGKCLTAGQKHRSKQTGSQPLHYLYAPMVMAMFAIVASGLPEETIESVSVAAIVKEAWVEKVQPCEPAAKVAVAI